MHRLAGRIIFAYRINALAQVMDSGSTPGADRFANDLLADRMKLLIIEDESELLDLITGYLRREGYVCETAADYRSALRKILNYTYDCFVIDLNLPGGNGVGLIKTIREDSTERGIVIISAREGIDDRIYGLDMGADDYLIKPFNLSELNARIKAVMRRKTNQFDARMVFDKLVIDPDARLVSADGELLDLTKKEFNILLYLARNRNRVVTKDSIVEHLWGDYMDEAVSFDFVYAHIKNLRRKLAAVGCIDYLRTVYGIGYKFQMD